MVWPKKAKGKKKENQQSEDEPPISGHLLFDSEQPVKTLDTEESIWGAMGCLGHATQPTAIKNEFLANAAFVSTLHGAQRALSRHDDTADEPIKILFDAIALLFARCKPDEKVSVFETSMYLSNPILYVV